MHLTIHRARVAPPAGPLVSIDGRDVPTLLLSPTDLAPLSVSFESAAAALETIPRLYFEPDGSFVWVGDQEGDRTAWQLDGQLHDRGETLDYVELKGSCSRSSLRSLWDHLRPGDEVLVFHLVRPGVFVDEATAGALLGTM